MRLILREEEDWLILNLVGNSINSVTNCIGFQHKLPLRSNLRYPLCSIYTWTKRSRNKTNLKLGFIHIRDNISYSESVFSKVLHEKKRKKEDVIWCDVPLKFKL